MGKQSYNGNVVGGYIPQTDYYIVVTSDIWIWIYSTDLSGLRQYRKGCSWFFMDIDWSISE